MAIPVRRPLVLDSPEFTARAENFANLMAVDDFQERFFNDPSGTAVQEFGMNADTATLSRTNQLTYALLADGEFNTWAADFQDRVTTILPSGGQDVPTVAELQAVRAQLVQEFSTSVQAHLAPETVTAVQDFGPGMLASEDDVAIILLTFVVVIVVVAVVAGVEQTVEALISRKTVQLVVRQLDQLQIERVAAGRALHER